MKGTAPCPGGEWRAIGIERIGEGPNSLSDVSIAGPELAWAVGEAPVGDTMGGMLLRFTDDSASRVQLPDLGGPISWGAVTSTSSTDAWAVGSVDAKPLAIHYDGSAWKQASMPKLANAAHLTDVAAIGADDAWAVGTLQGDQESTLAMHWDGDAWELVETPDPGAGLNRLNGVHAVASDDVWAVGGSSDAAPSGVGFPLVLHWDGARWSDVVAPEKGSDWNELNDVDGSGEADVVAVGYASSNDEGRSTLAMSWDGDDWKLMESPDPGIKEPLGASPPSGPALTSVASAGPSGYFIVGTYMTSGAADQRALTLHLAEGDWTIVASPRDVASMQAIGVRDDVIVTVGYALDETTQQTAFVAARLDC